MAAHGSNLDKGVISMGHNLNCKVIYQKNITDTVCLDSIEKHEQEWHKPIWAIVQTNISIDHGLLWVWDKISKHFLISGVSIFMRKISIARVSILEY